MIFNTTINDDEITEQINGLVGRKFSFWERIKLNGIGSRRMIIDSTHPSLTPYLNASHYLTYANAELRPKGILIHISKKLQVFTWAIPYYQLSFYKTEQTSIHAQGKFIHFREAYNINKSFFDKMLDLKAKALSATSHE